jgi:hypothetical protein
VVLWQRLNQSGKRKEVLKNLLKGKDGSENVKQSRARNRKDGGQGYDWDEEIQEARRSGKERGPGHGRLKVPVTAVRGQPSSDCSFGSSRSLS